MFVNRYRKLEFRTDSNPFYRLAELSAALQRKQDRLGLTLRHIERETGVSASTLSRLQCGKTRNLDANNYAALCRWLGAPLARFQNLGDCIAHAKDQDKLEIIIDLINRDPEIPDENKAVFVKLFSLAYGAFAKAGK